MAMMQHGLLQKMERSSQEHNQKEYVNAERMGRPRRSAKTVKNHAFVREAMLLDVDN
jgi:hypothetical protein